MMMIFIALFFVIWGCAAFLPKWPLRMLRVKLSRNCLSVALPSSEKALYDYIIKTINAKNEHDNAKNDQIIEIINAKNERDNAKNEQIIEIINANNNQISAAHISTIAKLELEAASTTAKISAVFSMRVLLQSYLGTLYPSMALAPAFREFDAALFKNKTTFTPTEETIEVCDSLSISARSRPDVMKELASLIHGLSKQLHYPTAKFRDATGFYCAGDSPLREATAVALVVVQKKVALVAPLADIFDITLCDSSGQPIKRLVKGRVEVSVLGALVCRIEML